MRKLRPMSSPRIPWRQPAIINTIQLTQLRQVRQVRQPKRLRTPSSQPRERRRPWLRTRRLWLPRPSMPQKWHPRRISIMSERLAHRRSRHLASEVAHPDPAPAFDAANG